MKGLITLAVVGLVVYWLYKRGVFAAALGSSSSSPAANSRRYWLGLIDPPSPGGRGGR